MYSDTVVTEAEKLPRIDALIYEVDGSLFMARVYKTYQADRGMMGSRVALCNDIAEFIRDTLQEL